jgi:hypothetical protein
MASTTVSVRIDPVIKKRLEKLAKSTGRSRSFLAAEAINEYLNLNEWQGTPQRPLTTPRWPRPALWPDRGQSSSSGSNLTLDTLA